MKYIIEFDKSLNDEDCIAIILESGAEHLGNIFANFELIDCSGEKAEQLKANSNVLSIQLDGYAKPQDAEPADFPMQMINVMENATGKGYKGDDVVVAVIDSGINYEHEDLQIPIYKCAKILDNTVVSEGVLSDIKDTHGHGTAVTSVVAMQDNDKGFIGVAPHAKMIIIKAVDANGGMSYASQAKSIVWAVDNGADVISISYAQFENIASVKAACEYAYNNDVSVVASAGNNGNSISFQGQLTATENVGFWKDYPSVVVVGSVKRKENWNGKLLPEFDISFHHYNYRMIYYSQSSKRYRVVLSDYPITIEKSSVQNGVHDLLAKGNTQIHDLFPGNSLEWTVYARSSAEWRPWFDVALGSNTLPILYSNHNIIDNGNGGIIYSVPIDLNVYREHFANNFNQYLSNYTDNPQNIIKAPYSSFGNGVDFVAPGYFTLPNKTINNEYGKWSGTSFSAPYVAGMIALLRQRFPNTTVDKIYDFLKSFSVAVDEGNPNYYGNGLVTMPDLSLDYVSKFYYKGKKNKIDNVLTL